MNRFLRDLNRLDAYRVVGGCHQRSRISWPIDMYLVSVQCVGARAIDILADASVVDLVI